jgi:hypothetical protein
MTQTTKDVTESVVVTDSPLKSAEAYVVHHPNYPGVPDPEFQGTNVLGDFEIWNSISNVTGQGTNGLAALTLTAPIVYWVD